MLRRAISLMVLTICLVACSCVSDYSYTTCIVEVTPTKTGLDRQLTMYRTHVSDSTRTRVALDLEVGDADRLERIYGVRPITGGPDTTAPYVGRGSFASVPNDLGNWGSVRSFSSSLGSSWMYMERIGGDPDPAATLRRGFAAADSVTDTILGWSEAELGQHPRWPALRSAIDVDLRRTLQNLVLEGVRDDSAMFDRFTIGVFEQPLSWMPFLVAPTDSSDEASGQLGLVEVRSHMARILELRSPAEVERVLPYLSSQESAQQSFARYVSKATGGTASDALRPWARVLESVLRHAYDFSNESEDSLAVRLILPAGIRDFDSNVRADSGLAAAAWRAWLRGLPNSSSGLPLVCWATWVAPDSALQRRLFGDVSLVDDDLADYCLWFNNLSARQQSEWSRMLTRLRPGKPGRLERFRFSDSKRGEDQRIPGRDLLLRNCY